MRRAPALVVFLVACARTPPPTPPRSAAAASIDVPALLLEVGAARTPSLRRPTESAEALADAARAGRGAERVEALRKLALVELFLAEDATDDRDAKRHRKAALRTVRDARGRTRDRAIRAELAFVDLWSAWRAGRGGAEDLATRFVDEEHEAGELTLFAWILKGEMALAREDFPQAAEAYRFVLAQLEHPLYAFALWRTAACYRGMGRDEDARQALREAEQIGSRDGAPGAARRVADAARAELGPAAAGGQGP